MVPPESRQGKQWGQVFNRLEVVVIGHEHPGEELPAEAEDGGGEDLEKAETIGVVAKDVLVVVAAGEDVPEGAFEFESERTSHGNTEATSVDSPAPRFLPPEENGVRRGSRNLLGMEGPLY
jgi:hypothetical protein